MVCLYEQMITPLGGKIAPAPKVYQLGGARPVGSALRVSLTRLIFAIEATTTPTCLLLLVSNKNNHPTPDLIASG
jgi:hypothetical protein